MWLHSYTLWGHIHLSLSSLMVFNTSIHGIHDGLYICNFPKQYVQEPFLPTVPPVSGTGHQTGCQTVCIPYRVWWWREVPNKDDKVTQNSSHWQTTSVLGWLSGTWGLRPGGVLGRCLTDKELMWVPVDTTARCEELSVQSCTIREDVKEKASPAYVWDKASQRQRCGVSWLWGCVRRWGISTWEVWWEQQWQLHTQPCCLDPCHLNWHYKWV